MSLTLRDFPQHGAANSVICRLSRAPCQANLLVSVLLFPVLSGCGAPGDPQPPSPPIPVAVTDLASRQQGNGVQLSFTLPRRTVNGDRLAEPPAIEIFRGKVKPNGAPDNKTFKLVYTVPGALADVYTSQEKIQFTDPLPADEVRLNSVSVYAYRVR